MPTRILKSLSLAAALLVAGTALAHDDAWLDGQKTPHGGQLRAAGAIHLELVLERAATADKESPVVVYLTDHGGQPVDAKGASGKATLLGAAGKHEIALQPAGGNRLQGSGRYAASPALKGIVALSLPGQKPVQARFTPFAARPADAHAGHKH